MHIRLMQRGFWGLVLACIALLASPAAYAWNDTGHMIVANIAWREMTPQARAGCIEILKAHPRYEQDLLHDCPAGADRDLWAFMKAATWPDIVRDFKNPMHAAYHKANWHYTTHGLELESPGHPATRPIVLPATAPAEGGEVDNSLKAMSANTAILSDTNATPAEKAVALCWMLHLAGDIHQPLHNVSLYNNQFPEGDRGGNELLVRVNGEAINLHALWDAILGVQTGDETLNLLAENICQTPSCQRRTLADSLAADRTPQSWSEEGVRLAADVYLNGRLKGLTAPSRGALAHLDPMTVPALPESYCDVARQVARQRAALAGYRVADLLNAVK